MVFNLITLELEKDAIKHLDSHFVWKKKKEKGERDYRNFSLINLINMLLNLEVIP